MFEVGQPVRRRSARVRGVQRVRARGGVQRRYSDSPYRLEKANSRTRLNEILRRLVDYCEEQKISPQHVMIDMDPVSVM